MVVMWVRDCTITTWTAEERGASVSDGERREEIKGALCA